MADFHITGDTKLDGSGFNSGLSAMQVAAGNIISNIVSTVTQAAGKAATAAVETGMSFDTAMSQVAATMGTTVDQIQDLSDKAKEMGAATKFTATEAAEGLNILAMAGLSAEESIAGIDTVLSLASAGAMSLESAASYVTGAVKGFADSMDNAQYYADLMAKGATLANTDVSGLGDAMSTAAATASGYRQSAEGVTLALLRLAEQNVTGSEAATALNRAMMDLYTPTDDAASALKALGVSAYDSSGNARDFNTVVDELSAALSGMSDEEANAYKNTIFTTYGLNAFNKMTVSSTEKVEEFKAGLAGASAEFNGAGSAAGQAATQLDNLEGDMTLLSSATDGLALAFYSTFSDAARSVVQEGTAMVSDLTTALESDGIPGVLSAAQEMASGLISGFVDNVIAYAPDIVSAGADAAANMITGIGAALPGVIETGAALIGTLASACTAEAPGLLQTGVDTVVSLINGLSSGMVQALPGVLSAAQEMALGLISCFVEQAPVLLQTGVDAAVSLVDGLSSGMAQAIPEFLGQALPMLVGFTGQLRENAGQLVDAGLNLILQLVQGIADSLPVLIENIPTIVSNIAGLINDNAPKILQTGIQIIGTLVKGIIQAIPTLIANIPQIVGAIVDVIQAFNWLNLGKSIIEAFQNGITNMVSAVKTSASSVHKGVVDALNQLPAKLKSLAKSGIDGFISAIKGLLGSVKSAATGVLTNMTGGLAQLPTKLLTIAKNAIQSIISAFTGGGWKNVGSNIVSGIASGLTAGVASLASKAASAAKGALDAAKKALGIQSPSRVFRDEVGKQIPAGAAAGIEQNADLMVDAAQNSAKDMISAAQSVVLSSQAQTSGAMLATGTAAQMMMSQAYPVTGSGNEDGSDGMDKDITINITCELDGRTVAQNTIKYIKRESRRTGIHPLLPNL